MREARMVLVLKGNLEQTGEVLRKIKEALSDLKLTSTSASVELEAEAVDEIS
jgi:hypothetical protein